ncbi:hypothetical protein L596_006088 [Steinernema carpocapsae]|uniref:Uncharacterized protein n=1 Tax=Steinernema carpocapsae TaxID=34508 RepID=A0A4U8V126_STECR|nr:hypothetical protein L596_006088 [Steinernema carpocapsae]
MRAVALSPPLMPIASSSTAISISLMAFSYIFWRWHWEKAEAFESQRVTRDNKRNTRILIPPNMSEMLYVVGVGVVALLSSTASATVCTVPGDSISTSDAANSFRYKNSKTCPDFKDDPLQTACCASQITPGTFYCCTEERKLEIESEISAELRRQFIRK